MMIETSKRLRARRAATSHKHFQYEDRRILPTTKSENRRTQYKAWLRAYKA